MGYATERNNLYHQAVFRPAELVLAGKDEAVLISTCVVRMKRISLDSLLSGPKVGIESS
jgi:uncharacterized protein YccT (UPF0319 family)